MRRADQGDLALFKNTLTERDVSELLDAMKAAYRELRGGTYQFHNSFNSFCGCCEVHNTKARKEKNLSEDWRHLSSYFWHWLFSVIRSSVCFNFANSFSELESAEVTGITVDDYITTNG